jgi:hypothetical protein
MKRIISLASFVGAMLAFCLAALPAHAQATRTWVSGVGDDANPCSRTAPCKTFAGAISKTAASGEINCLDPGGFGAVTITKSIIISCEYTEGGVVVAGTNGIVVNVASSDIVYLRGLDLQGLGTGLAGVSFIGAGVLHVEHCVIRRFNAGTAAGINMAPTGVSELFVSDSYITDNGTGAVGAGVLIRPTGAGSVNAALSRLQLNNNALGIKIDSTVGTGGVNLAVVDSVVSGNSNSGIAAFSTAGHGTDNVMINNTTTSNNAAGVRSDGPVVTVRIGNSVITGNGTATIAANGGTLQSYGNNQINGNGVDTTPPTTPLH